MDYVNLFIIIELFEVKLRRLRLPLSLSLSIQRLTDMMAIEVKRTSYEIPSSTISLTLNRTPSSKLPKTDIIACLNNVRQIANENPKSAVLEKVLRYHESSRGVRFAITATIYQPELTWGDVGIISGSLLDYFEETGIWAETIFYIKDEERGAMGDGLVRKAEADAKAVLEPVKSDVTGDGHKGRKGERKRRRKGERKKGRKGERRKGRKAEKEKGRKGQRYQARF